MLNDWSHKVWPILKEYCPDNIKKILPSSQSAWNTQFYLGHQKLCMDNNSFSCSDSLIVYMFSSMWANMYYRHHVSCSFKNMHVNLL